MRKKILLLGSSGFIGANLKEYFEEFRPEYSIDTPNSRHLNLLNEAAVKDYLCANRYDVIIHSAIYNPRTDVNKVNYLELENDLRMYFNIERYSEYFGKMLYFGSGAEFDKGKDICAIDDENAGNGIPLTQYGLSKYIINKNISASDNIINMRLFGLFGQYENKYKTFISGACCKALLDLPLTIRKNVYFDYLYVNDFCKIVDYFVRNNVKYKQYNICSGRKIELITIAKTVMKISGKILPLYVCSEGLACEYTASNKRMLDEIGGFQFTRIEEAIGDLYTWYKKHKNEIDMTQLLYQ